MGDNMSEDMVIDLDLNQEPSAEQPPAPASSLGLRLGPAWTELQTAHGRIEDRIRQLEAATARARQRQRWRQARNNPELSYTSAIQQSYTSLIEQSFSTRNENSGGNGVGVLGGSGGGDGDGVAMASGVSVGERSDGGERGRSCKRDISQLTKALEMDLDVKKADGGGDDDGDNGNFFDCNICLDVARDPVLTCCGHLFCWGCFYQVPYVDSTAKECPVCKGEVTDSSITPIYGNGKNMQVVESETGVKIPPRPRARRVESVRQQRVGRGISHIPVAEALRRIRIGIGSIGENPLQGLNGVSLTSTNHTALQNTEAGGSRRHRSRQFSRVLSESAASLSSISSALNNAERLVEDLETYINDRLRRTDANRIPTYRELDAVASNTTADSRSEPQTVEINSVVPVQSTVSTTVVHLDNLPTDSAVEIDLTISHPSSSSRRRNVISRRRLR